MTQAERIKAIASIRRQIRMDRDLLEMNEKKLRRDLNALYDACTHKNADGSSAVNDSFAMRVCTYCNASDL